MAKVLHICALFDPAGDVVRCVRELDKYSKHEHRLLVRHEHPLQDKMQFEQAQLMSFDFPNDLRTWPDMILCHFTGWPDDWVRPNVPTGFRNLNIRYSRENDKFFAESFYNYVDDGSYKLLAASHVGAKDFLDPTIFRWLPDLLPVDDPAYFPDFTVRPHCVSYIKQADEMDFIELGPNVKKLNLHMKPHAEILRRRKHEATIIFDNTIDGHWGLAGHEALLLGLPCLAFNHPETMKALTSYVHERYPLTPFDNISGRFPFLNVNSVEEAKHVIGELAGMREHDFLELRYAVRYWAEHYFSPCSMTKRFWDPFFSELLA